MWENPSLTLLVNNGALVCKRCWFCGHEGLRIGTIILHTQAPQWFSGELCNALYIDGVQWNQMKLLP